MPPIRDFTPAVGIVFVTRRSFATNVLAPASRYNIVSYLAHVLSYVHRVMSKRYIVLLLWY
jgi:hypothetical protein